jgi:O-antigen ligase
MLIVTAFGMLALTIGDAAWNDLLNRREDSIASRESIWAFAFKILPQSLPFGIGPNGFYDLSLQAGLDTGVAHAHDSWLSMLIGGGLLGGLCFTALTLLAMFSLAKRFDDLPLVTSAIVLSLVESPVYAGSNATLIPVAILVLLLLTSPNWYTGSLKLPRGELVSAEGAAG